MRFLSRLSCLCVFAMMHVVGCSEAVGDAGGSGGTGGTAAVGGAGGDGGTATLNLLPMELDPEGKQVPLVGVLLCETGTTNCAVSDASGFASIQLPAEREISYTHEKEGYGSSMRADILPAAGRTVVPVMPTEASRAAQYERLMSPYPMEGTGTIYIQVARGSLGDDPIAGATFDLLGTTGKAFFLDEERNWSLEPSVTTSAGVGGFVEVSPGVFEIEIGGTAKNCLLIRGWSGDSENTIRLPVREGYATIARVDCD
jgi:hypothetical protein